MFGEGVGRAPFRVPVRDPACPVCQVFNTNTPSTTTTPVSVTPASTVPAENVRAGWAATVPGQAIPMLGEKGVPPDADPCCAAGCC